MPVSVARPPVVVMAHGFTGTRDVALPYFAERFAHAGFAAFVFDYRYFGASGGTPRQLVDPWSQLEDWRAALAHVRTLTVVDHSRLSLWGSSLGGGHAVIIAAEEPNLRAVVAQAPLIDSRVEGEATFPGVLWAARLLLTGWSDLLWERITGEAITIPAIAPDGSFGMIVDNAAYAAFEKQGIPGTTYRNAVVARSPLTFDEYNPALQVKDIQAPGLLVASRTDRFAAFAAVEAAARVNPKLRIVTFAGDHFDVYSSPAREAVADATVAFLSPHLLKQ
jgi:alpha-beta hydrolase superfamily lysophospholipase